jgi:hypothetical protein
MSSKTAKTVKSICQYKYVLGPKKGSKCMKSCRGRYCCNHKPAKLEYSKQRSRQLRAKPQPKVDTTKGCQHVFVQGPKKGTKCLNPCRADRDRCRSHTQSKIEYDRKAWEEKAKEIRDAKQNSIEERIKNARDISELPSLENQRKKLMTMKSNIVINWKKIIGIQKFLDMNYQESEDKLHAFVRGNCKCKLYKGRIVDNDKEFANDEEYYAALREFRKLAKYCNACDTWVCNPCTICAEHLGHKGYCNNDCKYCFYHFNGITEYKGSNEGKAKELLTKYQSLHKTKSDRYTRAVTIFRLLSQKYAEF